VLDVLNILWHHFLAIDFYQQHAKVQIPPFEYFFERWMLLFNPLLNITNTMHDNISRCIIFKTRSKPPPILALMHSSQLLFYRLKSKKQPRSHKMVRPLRFPGRALLGQDLHSKNTDGSENYLNVRRKLYLQETWSTSPRTTNRIPGI